MIDNLIVMIYHIHADLIQKYAANLTLNECMDNIDGMFYKHLHFLEEKNTFLISCYLK